MSILKVAHLGNPVLRQKAEAVKESALRSTSVQRFLDDMVETMREYDGIGLAAPQVHVSQRLVVIEGEVLQDDPDVPKAAKQLLILVNPVLRPRGKAPMTMWEGCLSIPGLRGRTRRHRRVEVEALDRHGNPLRLAATGYFAGVLQHELDHLAGRVYLEAMPDLTTLSYLKEYRHFRDADSDAIDEIVT